MYGAYVAALPSPEYQPEIRELKREQVFHRGHIVRLVRAAHELQDNKKKLPPALAFISNGRNGGDGRGHPGPSEGVEMVDVDVATAETERLNPATTTERMLLRTARSLPKV